MAGAGDYNVEKSAQIASGPRAFVRLPLSPMTSEKWDLGKRGGGQLASFVIKTIALEALRRVSRDKCPFVWKTLQGLQVFCFPPIKWVQRWKPFGFLVKGMQMISRPMLILSIVNTFSDRPEPSNCASNGIESSHVNGDLGSGSLNDKTGDATSQGLVSTEYLNHLYEELEKQGLTLPERVAQDLHRHYIHANGDLAGFASSVKKTLLWRESFRMLPVEELELWSNLIFWHGSDVKHRPCLFVRLGLACLSLPSREKVHFTQALISQVEYGILNLMDERNPQITVLVDCQGLSPLRVPMQTMGHCCNILKEHFPNVLGCMIIIRAPPVVRVVANTFIKVLRASTRKKLRMEGEEYHKLLSELFQSLPCYLGGACGCQICAKADSGRSRRTPISRKIGPASDDRNSDDSVSAAGSRDESAMMMIMNSRCSQTVRVRVGAAVIGGILILLVAFVFALSPFTSQSSLRGYALITSNKLAL